MPSTTVGIVSLSTATAITETQSSKGHYTIEHDKFLEQMAACTRAKKPAALSGES